MRGMRHGYGVRTSATFGLASHYRPKSSARGSLSSIPAEGTDPASDRDRKIDDFRGGFVLKSRSDEPPVRRRSLVEKSTSFKKTILQGLKIKKQRSTGDIDRRGVSSLRNSGSNLSSASSESSHSGFTQDRGSQHTDSNVSFVSQDELCDAAVTETYTGEWKNDRRCGFGIAQRSDGLKYEGEWYNNKKYGYGVTTLKDGTREEGKYKNNVLVSSGKKKHLFMLRSAKFKERIDTAVNAALRGSQIALQKADIAISRTSTARAKAEQADAAAMHAREDSNVARIFAKQFQPDVKLPGQKIAVEKFNPDLTSRGMPGRTPFANLSNQSQVPLHSQESLATSVISTRTESSLESRQNDIRSFSPRSGGMQPPPDRYGTSPGPQMDRYNPTQVRIVPGQDRFETSPAMSNYPAKDMYQQDRYSNQIIMNAQQKDRFTPQPVVTVQQDPYQHQQQATIQQRYGFNAPSSVQQQQQPQSQFQAQKITSNYLGPSSGVGGLQDQPPVPNRQGSFRRMPAARDTAYTIQQSMSDHYDHYRQEPRQRNVIKHGRRIPSPPRGGSREMTPMGGMFGPQHYPSPRSSYGPDATPDSGVSESMDGDELSPSKSSRRSNLPMIYAESMASHASSLLSFAPSEEDRTMSPTMSSVGLDSELASEVSTGSSVFQRTASLFVNPPSRRKPAVQAGGVSDAALKRKKSLPHAPAAVAKARVIPREEVAVLSSQRREEVRRIQVESERLRANPLLYLVRPDFKDWFSRQQLIMLVLFINISLAVLFFKLLS